MRLLFSALLALLSHYAAATSPAITLGNGEWPPYMSEHLPHQGSLSRIVRAAFAESGINVNYVFYPWKRSYELARAGQLAGSVGWSPTSERERDFLFSAPIVEARNVFFIQKGSNFDWQQLSQLRALHIGVTRDYNYGPEFSRLQAEGILRPDIADNDETNFRKLSIGRIDAFPLDQEVGLHMLNQLSIINVEPHPRAITSVPLALIISRKHPQAGRLIEQFNAGLAKLKAKHLVQQFLQEGRAAKPMP